MKKCPQCQNLFPDETQYCLNDGQPLISQVLPLPSEVGSGDEEVTVVRGEPIVVDLSAGETLHYPLPPTHPPRETIVIPVPAKTKSNLGKNIAFLIIGLLLGGVLVLATLLLAKNLYQNNDSNKTPAAANLNSGQTPANGAPKETDSPANKPAVNPEHQKKTDVSDEEFNGRVISLNAYVRSSPDRNSAQVDVLPVNDRLTITSRDNPNSPWFFVVCEHGVSGWMHGNTIEYTR
jgi:hypothetical protein